MQQCPAFEALPVIVVSKDRHDAGFTSGPILQAGEDMTQHK